MLYHPIEIDNLNQIQTKILEHFPWQDISKISLFLLPKNSMEFLDIKELREMLINIGFLSYVHSVAFGVQRPNSKSGIHTDAGESSFSFNLPLYNCEKTFVGFYHSGKGIEKREYVSVGRKIFYNYCDPNYCTEIDRVEMNRPHIINVYTPHQVINPNNKFRITFLIRMQKSFDEFWCLKRDSNS